MRLRLLHCKLIYTPSLPLSLADGFRVAGQLLPEMARNFQLFSTATKAGERLDSSAHIDALRLHLGPVYRHFSLIPLHLLAIETNSSFQLRKILQNSAKGRTLEQPIFINTTIILLPLVV